MTEVLNGLYFPERDAADSRFFIARESDLSAGAQEISHVDAYHLSQRIALCHEQLLPEGHGVLTQLARSTEGIIKSPPSVASDNKIFNETDEDIIARAPKNDTYQEIPYDINQTLELHKPGDKIYTIFFDARSARKGLYKWQLSEALPYPQGHSITQIELTKSAALGTFTSLNKQYGITNTVNVEEDAARRTLCAMLELFTHPITQGKIAEIYTRQERARKVLSHFSVFRKMPGDQRDIPLVGQAYDKRIKELEDAAQKGFTPLVPVDPVRALMQRAFHPKPVIDVRHTPEQPADKKFLQATIS